MPPWCQDFFKAINVESCKRNSQHYIVFDIVYIAPTAKQWEVGDKHPCGSSQKLLNLLARKGLDVLI